MKTYHVDKPDQTIKDIVGACYPNYRGKSFKLSTSIPSRLESYWDEGSRTYYCFYHLDQKKSFSIGSNHPLFEASKPRDLDKLPDRVVIVAHSISCGKDTGITIYANPSDLAPMLPRSTNDLSDNEKIVLSATGSLKNSYAGENDIRFKRSRAKYSITREQWNEATDKLIAKGMLRKNGSITPQGRNVDTSGFRVY